MELCILTRGRPERGRPSIAHQKIEGDTKHMEEQNTPLIEKKDSKKNSRTIDSVHHSEGHNPWLLIHHRSSPDIMCWFSKDHYTFLVYVLLSSVCTVSKSLRSQCQWWPMTSDYWGMTMTLNQYSSICSFSRSQTSWDWFSSWTPNREVVQPLTLGLPQ